MLNSYNTLWCKISYYPAMKELWITETSPWIGKPYCRYWSQVVIIIVKVLGDFRQRRYYWMGERMWFVQKKESKKFLTELWYPYYYTDIQLQWEHLLWIMLDPLLLFRPSKGKKRMQLFVFIHLSSIKSRSFRNGLWPRCRFLYKCLLSNDQ